MFCDKKAPRELLGVEGAFVSYVIERMSYVKKRAAGIAIGRKKFATEAACHRWGGGRGGRERRMNIFAAWGGFNEDRSGRKMWREYFENIKYTYYTSFIL